MSNVNALTKTKISIIKNINDDKFVSRFILKNIREGKFSPSEENYFLKFVFKLSNNVSFFEYLVV